MATIDDINSTLQNIARQLGLQAQAVSNATPKATATSSPITYAFNNISTTATAIIASNANRHGVIFHNPGTANCYIYPTMVFTYPALTTTAPTTSVIGGSILVNAGSSVIFDSAHYPNVNCGWFAFSTTGSSQAFTVVEFY